MRPFLDNRNALGLAFMLPAAALLLVFLTYPLGLGLWLGFTDARSGRPGPWIGIDNFESLFGDSLARLSLFNTLFYTVIASVVKFALGLWLALLLNRHLPFKAFLRAIVLLPFIVPTALSAIAFWWIYDAQFSVVSWLLVKMGLIDTYIDFLGEPWMARFSTIAANVWRGVPRRSPRWSSSAPSRARSEEHTSELQSPCNPACRLLLENNNLREPGEIGAARFGVLRSESDRSAQRERREPDRRRRQRTRPHPRYHRSLRRQKVTRSASG